jgi:hypothetical protein
MNVKDANENPWYCLATLYGEQPEDKWNFELIRKNRVAWNRWMAGGISDKERETLRQRKLFTNDELTPYSQAEKEEIVRDFHKRWRKRAEAPPDPTQIIQFDACRFDRNAAFQGFLFPRDCCFRSAMFSRKADFITATFLKEADFNSVKFSGQAVFAAATFTGECHFVSTTFSGLADFSSATFSNQAVFVSKTFSQEARFFCTRFSAGANFSLGTFYNFADFTFAMFARWANFGSTTFSNSTAFTRATFSKGTNFGSAKFSGQADFAAATFSGANIFQDTTFFGLTTFAGALFENEVPDFRDAKLKEATEWHYATWPPPPKDKDAAQKQVYAYERLKMEMEKLKKHEDEQFFFKKELRARRALSPFWSGARLFNWLYEITSDYGHSILNPILALVAVWAFGWAAFSGWPVYKNESLSNWEAAKLSVSNIFSFLPQRREFMPEEFVKELSDAAHFVGGVQSFLALALLFLLGLALRNKFRMR